MADYKPVNEEDLGLTPKDLDDLVKGAQRYLPPTDEDGEPIETNSKDHAN